MPEQWYPTRGGGGGEGEGPRLGRGPGRAAVVTCCRRACQLRGAAAPAPVPSLLCTALSTASCVAETEMP